MTTPFIFWCRLVLSSYCAVFAFKFQWNISQFTNRQVLWQVFLFRFGSYFLCSAMVPNALYCKRFIPRKISDAECQCQVSFHELVWLKIISNSQCTKASFCSIKMWQIIHRSDKKYITHTHTIIVLHLFLHPSGKDHLKFGSMRRELCACMLWHSHTIRLLLY